MSRRRRWRTTTTSIPPHQPSGSATQCIKSSSKKPPKDFDSFFFFTVLKPFASNGCTLSVRSNRGTDWQGIWDVLDLFDLWSVIVDQDKTVGAQTVGIPLMTARPCSVLATLKYKYSLLFQFLSLDCLFTASTWRSSCRQGWPTPASGWRRTPPTCGTYKLQRPTFLGAGRSSDWQGAKIKLYLRARLSASTPPATRIPSSSSSLSHKSLGLVFGEMMMRVMAIMLVVMITLPASYEPLYSAAVWWERKYRFSWK